MKKLFLMNKKKNKDGNREDEAFVLDLDEETQDALGDAEPSSDEFESGFESGLELEIEYMEEEEYSEETGAEYMEEAEEEEAEYTEEDGSYEEELDSGEAEKKILGLKKLDFIIAAASAAVLLLAVVTGAVYIGAQASKKQIVALASVGTELETIELIGDRGLSAAANARLFELETARLLAEDEAKEAARAQREAEENKNYNENDNTKNVSVTMESVSVLKDLKLKFSNLKSGKLVSNVPFQVKVTTPDGKTETWTDDDMDGVIYKKNIAAGTYKVQVAALSGEKYAGYTLPEESDTVEVKQDIEYKKVDVKNEIKKETQVNIAKEDTNTASNNTPVESSLTDTVKWVESAVVETNYREVTKGEIGEPQAVAYASENSWNYATAGTVSGGDASVNNAISADKSNETILAGGNISIAVTLTGKTAYAPNVVSSNTAAATAVAGDVVTSAGTNGQTISKCVVTVTGVASGKAVITMTHPEDGSKSVTCSVSVLTDPKNDTQTKLKDKNGNQVYIYVDNAYIEAVYADYYKYDRFFVKGISKYTGWQTLDGSVYYFDADGNKVTGEQIIQGAKYNFASDGSLIVESGTMGIDVSRWNGSIDWDAVKNSGVSYVIIRCGYRGKDQGALIEDSKFKTNIQGAANAGLKVGIYFFSQAVDEVEAVEEASMVLELIKGYRISYPVFIDVESSGGRGDNLDKTTLTAVCKTFCQTIQNGGYTAGVYSNKSWFTTKMDMSVLNAYKIWLAQYAAEPTYSGRYDLWQYKATGRVSGISGDVDMNISYLGY